MDKHYIEEIRLSRELAKEIGELDEQYRGLIPKTIWNIYLKLQDHYQKEIEDGIQ
jgi:hypothetical protein